MVWEYVVPFYEHHTAPRFGLTNLTYRAHRYGPDYPGLLGKRLDSGELDLWNRLYGPEAFNPWMRPAERGVGRTSVEESEPDKEEKPGMKEEPKPAIGKPGDAKLRSRLERLGY
jgi:hypothetical protein